MRDQEHEVESWGELQDSEEETLRRLAAIRAAIAGEVTDAEGLDAVRAALARLFEGFVIHHGIPERAHVELIGETWIEPVVREEAVEGYGENLRPVLRREPLAHAVNKERVGLPCRYASGPW
jgi:hypothetical protein